MASTRIGTLFLDENLAIRRFTPEIRRVLKILDSDIGRPVNHLVHTLTDVDLFALMEEVADTAVEREREVRTQDGAWLLMRILPYRVGAGAISGVVLTFIDIGLLKTTQVALSERETQLASLYRAAPVGIGRVVGRRFMEVNERVCQMLGYTREELVGHNTRIVYPSDQEFEFVGQEKYEQIRVHGVGTVETRWRRKDGGVFPVLLSSSPLSPANPDEGSTFTVLDISSRARAVEQAQASEARYRQLFDTMAEGVVYQNADGEIISANPAACRILGLSNDQIAGRTSADPNWRAIGEDGAELPGDQHPSMIALRTGQPVTSAVMGIFNPQLEQTCWIRVNAIPLFEPDDNSPGQVYATFNDITEVIESTRALARAQDELNIIRCDRTVKSAT